MNFNSTMTRMAPTDFYYHNVREYNPLCGQRIYRATDHAIWVKKKLENDDTSSSDEPFSKICKQGRIKILNCPTESNRPVWTLPTFHVQNKHFNKKKRGDMLVACNLEKRSKVCVGSKIRAKGTSCWKKLQQLFDTPCSSIGNNDRNNVVLHCPKNLIHPTNQLHCIKSTTTVCNSTNEDIQQESCDVPAGYTRPKVLWQLVTNTGNLLPVAVAENPSCPETWVKLDMSPPPTHCPTEEISQGYQNKPDNQLFTCNDGDFPLPIYVPSKDKETSNLNIKKKCQVLWSKSQDVIQLENNPKNCTINSEMKKEQCEIQFNSSENSKELSDQQNIQLSSNTESFFSDWWSKPVTLPDQFSCKTPKLKPTSTSCNQNNWRDQNSFENPVADRASSGQSLTENVPPEVPLESLEEVQQGLLGRLIDIPGTPNSMSLFLPLNRDKMQGGARLLYSAPQEAASNCLSRKSRATQTSSHNDGKIVGVWHSATFHGKHPFLRFSALPDNNRNVIDSEYSTWTKYDTIDVSTRKTNKPHRVIGSTRLDEVANLNSNQYSQLRYTSIKDKVLPGAQDRSICNTELSASNNLLDNEKLEQIVCERNSNERSKTQDKPIGTRCVTADSQNVGNSSSADEEHDQRKIPDGKDRKDQRTCDRCAFRRGKPIRDLIYTDLSKIDNLSVSDFSPEEIMKSWTPSPRKSAILQPSPDYVDLTLKDFSLKKYLPETSKFDKEQELISKEASRPGPSKSINQAAILEDKKQTTRTTFWIELKPKTEDMTPGVSTLDRAVKDGLPKKKNMFFSSLGKNRNQHAVEKQTIQEPVYRLPEISVLKDKTLTTSLDQVPKVERSSLIKSDSVINNIHVGMPVAGSKQKILIPISIPTSSQPNPITKKETLTDASMTSDKRPIATSDASRHRVALKIHLANNTEEDLKDPNR